MLNDKASKHFKPFQVLSGFKTRRCVATSASSELVPHGLLSLGRVASVKAIGKLPELAAESTRNANPSKTNPPSIPNAFLKSSQPSLLPANANALSRKKAAKESEQTISDENLVLLYEARCKVKPIMRS